ncbi:bifunctional demethylmenaquinone methyltransferase/2-methoxy-6-polyprenyl-1,4-benzoquinol methylase UbiE [Methylotenera sp.]|uniref:bifunctional demethylmenaquinone methyltransferase/2-methoxy-6-polyprenyl-1,4-benzoquinol methylase UbiE n=1 Tax=Methylotenera sp. TaxID=2051956 RepID=UPI002730F2A0|nr:bifunctional demethylmenaquinone methyltransferase/2-methoxy-6-polyprenyl-1,4-benzoquinol methylase UbiE [Methylotenera sp.]MDP2070922.1 bifunctional demethylmenaquinone methyltransferase/2-methoxy-6-polyprenyl-1,4-benzoquinol methylase UbiE [Methylotenera sp.]MDP3005796.1 bifunctional demethylmenaquinone methyltransferase/2-methoxy-6-polyprenyl-1,4-benzoquinol methylase UbiE [Methylotenera sp.]
MTTEHNANQSTHFGFKTVAENEKAKKVGEVFHSVASKYDLMNDVMSAGMHRGWKHFAVEVSGVKSGDKVLDIAGGSGDLSKLFAKKVGADGQVILTDINASMLSVGRDRMLDAGLNVPALQCDAEKLPFPDNHFDCVIVAFGLRNMTHKDLALAEMQRVLKVGGRLLVLEFSKVWQPLSKIYDAYSFKLLPFMGKILAKDAESYQYLAESIRMHPDQEALKQMIVDAGLNKVDYYNLSAGVVALHKGYKT